MDGTVFHIQRFSLFDGPGVRTVVFLKGCPLRCKWCHNPEGIAAAPQVMFDPAGCIGCGECVSACPDHRHRVENGAHTFLRVGCGGCGGCAGVCPAGALSMAGARMDTDAVMDAVMRDLPVFRESGGGMTLSGGEPLYQPEFAVALLQAAKSGGIHTCVETSGQAAMQALLAAAEFTDEFYFDYKATGDEMHMRLCGAPQGGILENLAALCGIGARITLRCPIVPGENDTEAHIDGIGRIAGLYGQIGAVHLLPYHKLGVSKSRKLGQTAAYDGDPPGRERLAAFCKQIRDASGKNCEIV